MVAVSSVTRYGSVPLVDGTGDGKARARGVAEVEGARGGRPDRFPYYLSAVMQVLRWIFWLAAIWLVLQGLQPIAEVFAGEDTSVDFNLALNASVAVNIAGAAGVAALMRRNKKLGERVRDLEKRLPPQRPQLETLPLPEDGA